MSDRVPIEFSISKLRVDEAARAASLHRQAFPSFFLSTLGERFLTRLYVAFAKSPDAVTIAIRSRTGVLLGCAVGSKRPQGFFKRLLRNDFIGFGFAALPAVARNPRIVPRVLRGLTYRGESTHAPHGALLSSICVAPHAQGQGFGKVLLTEWIRTLGDEGVETAYLQTDADNNDATNAFYTRLGWVLAGDTRTPEGRRMNTYTFDLTTL